MVRSERLVRRAAYLVTAAVLTAACGDDEPVAVVDGVVAPDGFDVTVVVDDLDFPTQIDLVGGRLVVAELAGAERAGTGRVRSIDLSAPTDREVLVDGLLTPTGVAVDGELLWIMERRRLTVGPVDRPTERTVILDELPYNGRSEGTLTAVEGGGILYDTSGTRDPERPAVLEPGSGTLWSLESPDAEPVPLATGFKHAYAHTRGPGGELFVTEMSDGRLDGATPPDELVVVAPGDDFGYPVCIGDGVPVAELGADAATCRETPGSHALFAPGATPTSVVIAPWDPSTALVALWNVGDVVAVPVAAPDGEPHRGEPFLTGIEHPQHLLVDGDRLLVVDFDGGRVLAVAAR